MKILLIASTVVMLTITGFTSVKNKKADTGIPMTTGAAEAEVTVTSITPNTAKFTWIARPEFTSYNVVYYDIATYEYFESPTVTTNSITLTNLKLDHSYGAWVHGLPNNPGSYFYMPVDFTTHTNHCYANKNGVMSICNGGCSGGLETCSMEPLTGPVAIPGKGIVLPNGWTTTGVVKPGYFVDASSAAIKIFSQHPTAVRH